MKKINEKDLVALWMFCIVTSLITDVLCILFLLNVVQNHWFLNFIQALALLLHLALLLLCLMKKKWILCGCSGVLVLLYMSSLVFYNIT